MPEAEVVEPARAADRQIGDGGDAALQQLRQGHRGRGPGVLCIEPEHRQIFVERTLAELVAADLLGQALVGRFGEGMAVHVDEAGNGHETRARNHAVRRAGIARSDMQDFVAREHQVGVGEIDVPLFGLVPANSEVEALNTRGSCTHLDLPFTGKTGMIGP